MSITRDELYEQIWSKPMRDVAASHGVSGSFLTKVCRRMNIPCPPTGYWARIAAGQSPRKLPLSVAQPWDDIGWTRQNEPWPQMSLPQAPDPSTLGKRRWRGLATSRHET